METWRLTKVSWRHRVHYKYGGVQRCTGDTGVHRRQRSMLEAQGYSGETVAHKGGLETLRCTEVSWNNKGELGGTGVQMCTGDREMHRRAKKIGSCTEAPWRYKGTLETKRCIRGNGVKLEYTEEAQGLEKTLGT